MFAIANSNQSFYDQQNVIISNSPVMRVKRQNITQVLQPESYDLISSQESMTNLPNDSNNCQSKLFYEAPKIQEGPKTYINQVENDTDSETVTDLKSLETESDYEDEPNDNVDTL